MCKTITAFSQNDGCYSIFAITLRALCNAFGHTLISSINISDIDNDLPGLIVSVIANGYKTRFKKSRHIPFNGNM